jgi:Flp pilus assembly protein TadG
MRRVDPQCGAVFVEFLIVFPPLLMLILGLVQTGMLYVGHAVTQRSANAATRAAVVILDDDPRYYGGAPRNSATGARKDAITRAAAIPFAALSADTGTVKLGIGVGESSLQRNLSYALEHTTVSFPGGTSFGETSDVTVRVTFDYSCGIPIGRYVVCGADHKVKLSTKATLPNQGAGYAY